MEELDQDRLSSLPKIILHNILSNLPEKDVVRTSVLSKAWLDTWYTFPILSFSIYNFIGKSPMEDSEKMRKMLGFCDYVKRTILRFRDQRLIIKEFKLGVNSSNLISNDVDTWLKLACECGVKVIDYSMSRYQDQYHVLPMCVIESKSLTELVLFRFIKIDPIFMNHPIKFSPLRILSLTSVLLGDEHVINDLISFCPLIESITLIYCYVLSSDDGKKKKKMKSLSISGLQKFKRVYVSGIQNVSIDAPSLENLCYYPKNRIEPFNIDFHRCKNLKELFMSRMTITFWSEKWFLDLFPKFPFLESLKLSFCEMSERIYISSVRLKVLKLSFCSNLKEVNIDAPNLLSCKYKAFFEKGSGALEPMSFLRSSSQLQVNIQIHVDYVDLF